MTTPSACEATIAESVTGRIGGVSTRITSYTSRTEWRKPVIAGVDRSSDGLAGTGPASMMCRLSRPGAAMMSSISNRPIRISATVRMQSRHCALPTRMFESPGSRSIPKNRWMLGRRMFAPMSRVFCPLCAIVRARLTIVVVLPSCRVGLDTTRTLPERSMRANWMLVRSVR